MQPPAYHPRSAPQALLLDKGDLVAGKYRVERVIGQDENGQVVSARHVELGNLFAIKVLRADSDRNAIARFMREGQLIGRIQSNHVIRIHDVGQTDRGLAYMVMEHLDGQDLGALMAARGALPVDEAVGALLEGCEGLAEAHAIGVVHRDLKPASLFLARRSVTGDASVKVIDFGVGKPTGPANGRGRAPTDAEAFTAPEQLNGEATPRSDVWALGATLYKLLSGKHPFAGKNAAELSIAAFSGDVRPLDYFRQDVPSEIEAVIMRCLRKIPEERYPDARALGDALLLAYSNDPAPDSNTEATVARSAPRSAADYLASEKRAPRGEPRTVALPAAGNAAGYLAAEQQHAAAQHAAAQYAAAQPPAEEPFDDEPGGEATMIRAPLSHPNLAAVPQSGPQLPVAAPSRPHFNAPPSGPQLPVARDMGSNPQFSMPVSGPHLPAAAPSGRDLQSHPHLANIANMPVSGPHLPAAAPSGRRLDRDESTIIAPIETIAGRFPLTPSSQPAMTVSLSKPQLPVSPAQPQAPAPATGAAPTRFVIAESNLDARSRMMLILSGVAIAVTALCLIAALMWRSSAQKQREAASAARHQPAPTVVVSVTPPPPVAPVVIAPPGDVAPIVAPPVDTGADPAASAEPAPSATATAAPTATTAAHITPGPRPTATPAGPRPAAPSGGKKPKKAVYDTP